MFSAIKKTLFQNTSEKQTVAKNTFWLTGSEIAVRLIRFGLIVWVARILGAEGWGLFSYTLSLLGMAMMFSDGGISSFFIREYTNKQEKYLKTILVLKFSVLAISGILALVFGFFFASLPVSSLVIPVAIILLFDSLRGFLEMFLRAQEQMEKEALNKIITNSTLVITSILLVSFYKTPESLAVGYAVGSIIGTLSAFWINRTFVKNLLNTTKKIENNTINPSPIISYILPITLSGIVITVMLNTDSVMLGIWTDAEQVGLYASAQRILQFTLIIPGLFTSALFPTLSKIYQENKDRFNSASKKAFNTLLLVGTPIAIGGFFLATPIMSTFFGSSYTLAGSTFGILILGMVAIAPNTLLQTVAIITEQQKRTAIFACIAMILAIILNVFLIPKYGIWGAAFGTTLAQFSLFILNATLFLKIITPDKKTVRDIIFAITVMVLSIKYIPNIHVIFSILIGGLIYFGVLLALKNQNVYELIRIKKTP